MKKFNKNIKIKVCFDIGMEDSISQKKKSIGNLRYEPEIVPIQSDA